MYDLLIRNCSVVNGEQEPSAASIGVIGSRIVALLAPDIDASGNLEIDGSGKYIFPGLIDPHVHYRYNRGYQRGNDDYLTETRSALVGGITTAIRMHRELSSYGESIPAELDLLRPHSHIDIAFHLAIMTEAQLETFPAYAGEYGINSFKLYLAYKGEAGRLQGLQGADDGFLYDAMRRIGRLPNGIACVHAENSEIAERLARQLQHSGRNDLAGWTEARPGWSEGEAIRRAGIIAHHAECPLYVVHVSSQAGIEAIEDLREQGVQVYTEVCAHHLSMTVDEASEHLGSLAKVNPPLRSANDVEHLWDAIKRGVVDTVGTDHVPHTREKARRSFWEVMPGFPGSATMLPVLITEGYHKRHIPLSRIAALTSRNAARLFQLKGKGEIVVGAEASLSLVNVDDERVVEPQALQSVADFSLYEGRALKGFPSLVVLRGQVAMRDGIIHAQPGSGQYVCR